MLQLRQDLVIVSDDKKGKFQSWEASLSFNIAGGDLYLYAYGDCEEEARSHLEEKFRELIEGVTQTGQSEVDDQVDGSDLMSGIGSFSEADANAEAKL